MGVDIGAANARKVLQAEADASLTRDLAHQQRVGLHLSNIAREGSLDAADIGVVRIVIDIDDRREIITDTERAHFVQTGSKYGSLVFRRKEVEISCSRQRLKAARFL